MATENHKWNVNGKRHEYSTNLHTVYGERFVESSQTVHVEISSNALFIKLFIFIVGETCNKNVCFSLLYDKYFVYCHVSLSLRITYTSCSDAITISSFYVRLHVTWLIHLYIDYIKRNTMCYLKYAPYQLDYSF